jgi:mono/diheme cytochrome c family protein
MSHRAVFFLAAVLVAASAQLAPAQDRRQITEGRALARDNCARCHAIGKTGRSHVRTAPAFRDLNKRYNVDDLEEAFVEGIAVRHGEIEMPEFTFSPERTAALLAYIKSLKKR